MAKQTFTTGQVLTAAQMTSLQETAMGGGSPSAKTTSYILVAADAGTVIQMNAAGSTTITVNTGLFSAGDSVQIQNIGAGVCTITAGTATVNTAGSLALSQWEGGYLYFTSASSAIFFDIVQSAPTTSSFVGCIATRTSGTQAVSAATITAITLPTEEIDTDGFHDTSTNTSRFTIPTGKGGKYLINVLVGMNQSVGNYGELYMRLNGSNYTSNGYTSGGYWAYVLTGGFNDIMGYSTTMVLAAGDYIEIALRVQATAGVDISKARISLIYLGA